MEEVYIVLEARSLLDFLVLVLIYFLFFFKRWKKKDRATFIINTLMYCYIAILLFLTLMPILTSIPNISLSSYKPMYLVPFDDLIKSKGPAERQIFLNVLMLVPFGFLLPMIKKQNVVKVTLTTMLMSLTIEVIQPLLNTYRISDVTDVITNTIGGVLGYLIYKACQGFIEKQIFKRKITNYSIRDLEQSNLEETYKLFYNTVMNINKRDYDSKQRSVWAPQNIDFESWRDSFNNKLALVMLVNHEIVGFADVDQDGYIDRFYVHYKFQNMSVGKTLLEALEKEAIKRFSCVSFTTYSSITALPFFERFNYEIEHENIVIRNDVELTNYYMKKEII